MTTVPLTRDRLALWMQLAGDPAYPWYREPIDVALLLSLVCAADELARAVRHELTRYEDARR